MSDAQSMVAYYANRALEYERVYDKPERQEDLRTLRDVVGRTFAGKVVLEVACGTGYWTKIIADSAVSVVATDINEEVLAVARSKSLDPSKVVFRREDAYRLPTLSQKFDAGFCGFWWSHLPKDKIRGFLAEFHRAIAPGATVMFLDNAFVEGSSTPISRTDEQGNTYQIRSLADGSKHEVLKNFPTRAELIAAVKGMGSDVHIEFLNYYWVLTYSM